LAVPLKVACVGASITAGVGTSRPAKAYPAVLGRLLGPGYQMRNFGVSGRTLLSAGDAPWVRERACAECLAWQPDLVVIDLGGNDSKPQNWAHKAEFKGDYAALVARFAALPSHPRIFACTPTPTFPENYGIRDSVIAGEILPLMTQIAAEQAVTLIDLHAPFVGLGQYFPDRVHPNDAGAAALAMVVYSVLATPVDPANTALTPVPKLEQDSYDWYARHQAELALGPAADPEVVLIGDSITHFWGGQPKSQANAPAVWDELFAGRRVVNLGFGWDRTQNVLWRLDHGEFDGWRPKLVVVLIGTNNLTGTDHARENTPAEIAAGIAAVVDRVRAKSPFSQVLLMGILPRGEAANDPFRPKIKAVNALLAPFAAGAQIGFVDLADKLLEPDGRLSPAVAPDGTHPSPEGYRRWAEVIKTRMDQALGL
jgi:lysophospholipase L1-like esterase